MAQAKPKFYLTTPIYYTNGLPHIGHTYSTIVCDTIRRYKRMRGYDVIMTTGTDEPGENCPDCGRPTETGTEKNFYFNLSEFGERLRKHYAENPEFIQPEARRNEVLSFVEGGLRDLSITRTSIRWGIPVPGEDPHVFYVWFDALTAYLSAVGGQNYQQSGYSPAALHLVGKEIIRFHAVYWPAFFVAAGLPLPKQV